MPTGAYSDTKQVREKQVRALMNLHGLSRKEADARAAKIAALRKVKAVRKNPATPRATKRKTKHPGTMDIFYPTFAKFSKDAKAAGENPQTLLQDGKYFVESDGHVIAGEYRSNPVQKKLQSRPKPSGRLNKRVFTVEMKHGDEWRTEGIFPTETSAREYARALDAKHGHAKYIRVTV